MDELNLLGMRDSRPKDLLAVIQNRPERVLEVLREIIDVPDYSSVAGLAQQALPVVVGNTTGNGLSNITGWGTGVGMGA